MQRMYGEEKFPAHDKSKVKSAAVTCSILYGIFV